jgi:hypothetical protein
MKGSQWPNQQASKERKLPDSLRISTKISAYGTLRAEQPDIARPGGSNVVADPSEIQRIKRHVTPVRSLSDEVCAIE